MRFAHRREHALLFAAVMVFATSSVASPQVPNAQDIAACNVEAPRRQRGHGLERLADRASR